MHFYFHYVTCTLKKSLGTCQLIINFIYFNYKMAKRIVYIVYRKTTYLMKNCTAFRLHFLFAMFVFKVVCIFCSILIKLALLFHSREQIPSSSAYNKGIMIGYVILIYILSLSVTYVTFNTTWTVLSIQKENLSDTILFNH